jgi:DNA-binding SARP family transcriptional activator/predicted ATPase
MAQLSLCFLGPFTVTLDNEPIAAFETDKVRALLAYLAVESDRPHRRQELAGLLWPDWPERSARTNLRNALSNLRKAIGDRDADPPFLFISRESLQFNAASDSLVDVTVFRKLVATDQGAKDRHQRLEEALDLYRGPFLAGFSLKDSPSFEDWSLVMREALQREALNALDGLAEMYESHGEYERACEYATWHVAMAPWREDAHRRLMRLLALRGQRGAALAQYDACRIALAEELKVEPGPETTDLYERIRDGEFGSGMTGSSRAVDRIALRATNDAGETPHNLPAPTTAFVGRDKELAELAGLLAEPEHRLITVVGPGGSGKTRLALEAGAMLLDSCSDGVFLALLAPLDSAENLVPALAQVLGVRFHQEVEPREQLLDYLRNKTMLIILDSFEHLLTRRVPGGCSAKPDRACGTELVSEILKAAPGVKALVTSRVTLNLAGEYRFQIAGLEYPELKSAASTSTPEELVQSLTKNAPQYGAINLFLQSARRAQTGFELTNENLNSVVQICSLVDGIPLAILLATAWVEMLTPAEIAAEIRENLDFLEVEFRDVPLRQRSMRAVFDHSWKLLTEREREIFQGLSVFRGGFTREAAEAVTGASLRDLMDLMNKSLLHRSSLSSASLATTFHSASGVEWSRARYEMHELLRQYAAEKLDCRPALSKSARDQHSGCYLAFLQRQERHLKGPQLRLAMAAISDEIDNVRLAWRWAIEQGKWAEIKGAMESLWIYFDLRGWLLEGNEVFAKAVTKLRQQYELLPAAETSALPGEIGLCFGALLAFQGEIQDSLGHYGQTQTLSKESLAVLQVVGPSARRQMAFTLALMASSAHRLPATESEKLLQESYVLFDEIGDPWGSGRTQMLLGQHYEGIGRFDEAEHYLRKSLGIFRTIGEQIHITYCTSTLGRIAMARGQNALAEKLHRECLTRRIALGDQQGIAFTLIDLGNVTRLQGEHAQAEEYYRQGTTITKEIGVRSKVAVCLWGLSDLAEMRGDYAEAKRLAQESKVFYPDYHSDLYLGWAVFGEGDYRGAERYFYRVLELATAAQSVNSILHALTGLAHVLANVEKAELALELVAFILGHPAVHQEFRRRAIQLQAKLTAELSPDFIATVQNRGQSRDLWTTAAELLGTLSG